jgi:hypothetical protein
MQLDKRVLIADQETDSLSRGLNLCGLRCTRFGWSGKFVSAAYAHKLSVIASRSLVEAHKEISCSSNSGEICLLFCKKPIGEKSGF